MAKSPRKSNTRTTRSTTRTSSRARTGSNFRPPKRKSSAPTIIAIFVLICGGIFIIKPYIFKNKKKHTKAKKEIVVEEIVKPDTSNIVDKEAQKEAALEAEKKRLAQIEAEKKRRAEIARKQKELAELARQKALKEQALKAHKLASETLNTMLNSFSIEIPDIKIVKNDGVTVYGKVKTKKPLMIKTVLGNWQTFSSADIISKKTLIPSSAKREIKKYVQSQLKTINHNDVESLFKIAHLCRVTNYTDPIKNLIEQIIKIDQKFGIKMQNKFAGKIYRDSLYKLASGQKGLAKKGFKTIPKKYPHSSYASDAGHFASATSVDMNAMIDDLQEEMGIDTHLKEPEYTVEDSVTIKEIEEKVADAPAIKKGDTFFKQALKIYKTLDTGAANYKRKNAAALHLFIQSVDAYQKALKANPNNKKLDRKLQKATMLRYGCMKMSTL